MLLLQLLEQFLLLNGVILEVGSGDRDIVSVLGIRIRIPLVLVLHNVLEDVRLIEGWDLGQALQGLPLHVCDPGELLSSATDHI